MEKIRAGGSQAQSGQAEAGRQHHRGVRRQQAAGAE